MEISPVQVITGRRATVSTGRHSQGLALPKDPSAPGCSLPFICKGVAAAQECCSETRGLCTQRTWGKLWGERWREQRNRACFPCFCSSVTGALKTGTDPGCEHCPGFNGSFLLLLRALSSVLSRELLQEHSWVSYHPGMQPFQRGSSWE